MDLCIQTLNNSYSKYTIEKVMVPSYVQMYTQSIEEIILIYYKNKQTINEYYEDTKTCAKEELELTGSPLKLDLSLHTILDETLINDEPQLFTKEEIFHGPISIEKAREIAIKYNDALSNIDNQEASAMWILCNPSHDGKPLLLMVTPSDSHFTRGMVSYEGSSVLDEVDLDLITEKFAEQEMLKDDMVKSTIECEYHLSGNTYTCKTTDEMLNTPQTGLSKLHCEWTARTLMTPFISCKVLLEQEVIVGHLSSPCNSLWKSVCALHSINQLLVDMTAAGNNTIDLKKSIIRQPIMGERRLNNKKRLSNLLNEAEIYAYSLEKPKNEMEDIKSIHQCLSMMSETKASTDFTHALWDILRDCETADELVTLLIQALKFISTGKIRPCIDVNNKSYLAKLVLKLSRGHSQASKVLSNLLARPLQALSLAAQVCVEKSVAQYGRAVALAEHCFYLHSIWTTENMRSAESIEQINQTIQDMTMGGDYTLNPFDNISTTADQSIRLDCESISEEDAHELTVDDFASLKKHGLVSGKKDSNEVPIITDEIDISPWKNLLMRFAQVHVCLEHLYRAETCLRLDLAGLKPIASRLLEHYVSDRSPVRTPGQLISDPVQKITMPIANNIVLDHLKKPASWYRMEISRNDDVSGVDLRRDAKQVFLFTQQPVFPPAVWQIIEPQSDDVAEMTTVVEELKYHCTKYTYLRNQIVSKLTL